ncbi:MAG: hypothetical protein AB7H97_22425, partial [Pseudobdellovibrionaceae bacterium]
QQIRDFLARFAKLPKPSDDGSRDPETEKFYLDPQNWLVFLTKRSRDENDPVMARKEIEASYGKRDAALIAKRDFRKMTLPVLGTVYIAPRRNQPRPGCADFGWAENRCKRALAVLESWEVDFDWSASQHLLGAMFAYRNCGKLAKGETLESLACKALQH